MQTDRVNFGEQHVDEFIMKFDVLPLSIGLACPFGGIIASDPTGIMVSRKPNILAYAAYAKIFEFLNWEVSKRNSAKLCQTVESKSR